METTTSDDTVEDSCARTNSTYLFQQMETERAKIPYMLREEYLPVFIVKCLREKLVNNAIIGDQEDSATVMRKRWINPFVKASTEDTLWSNDTLLEDNVDFEGLYLLSKEGLNYAGRVLRFATNAMECFTISRSKFAEHFISEFEYPCLELLYLMDSVYNLLPLTNYLLGLKEPSQVQYFKKQLISFVFSPIAFSSDTRERSTRILQRFLQCLILSHYCNICSKPCLREIKNISGEILRHITLKLICEENLQVSSLNHKIVLAIQKDVDIPKSVRIRYISEHLNLILDSGKKPFLSEMEVLQYQEKYADPIILLNMELLTQTISQMMAMLRTDNIFQIVASALNTPQLNWERLLFFFTVWFQEKQSTATSVTKDLSKKLIQDGLINKSESDVMKGFIIARHCSTIASESFSRYEKWFTNVFNSETYSIANEPETFSFLIETLTKWIPVEPSCFLHVHTTFWPFVPKGCRDLWSDYLATAKVRISEYKEVEEAMEYEPNPNDPIQHEVGMAIKSFESRGKIPQSIIKMTIFSKPYYTKVFLPALLRKPTNVALSDSRLRLIELLKREGKIPDDMYKEYKSDVKES